MPASFLRLPLPANTPFSMSSALLPTCTDGANPLGGLVQATDGNFYGTTEYGGTGTGGFRQGVVFKITPAGKLTVLYNFCSLTSCTDGSNPYGGLVQATDGNFYGTTIAGGTNNFGTIFQITPKGKYTVLHSFENTTAVPLHPTFVSRRPINRRHRDVVQP
jgi:uncharacterized repeat protein (TIGR03803 family)